MCSLTFISSWAGVRALSESEYLSERVRVFESGVGFGVKFYLT